LDLRLIRSIAREWAEADKNGEERKQYAGRTWGEIYDDDSISKYKARLADAVEWNNKLRDHYRRIYAQLITDDNYNLPYACYVNFHGGQQTFADSAEYLEISLEEFLDNYWLAARVAEKAMTWDIMETWEEEHYQGYVSMAELNGWEVRPKEEVLRRV
jgi:adenylate cyclase